MPHQSPQAICLRDARACWHASHYDVTAAALELALKARRGGPRG